MKSRAINSPQTAVSILDQLLAQARRNYRPGDTIIVQKQVMTSRGRCRVAVVISRYGIHLEIGPRESVNDSVAWPFREQDLVQAVNLLKGYLRDESMS